MLPRQPLRWTSRCYETEEDLRQVQALLIEGRSRTNDWHYPHVGELLWEFFLLTSHLNPREHVRLWHDERGRLVGYAILGEGPSFDCQALPEQEDSGLVTEAMTWVGTRVAELRQRDRQRWGGPLATGARRDNTRRIALLEQRGFRYSGAFAEVNMLRSLREPIPECVCPAEYQVRAVAEVGETPKRAAVQREVWLPSPVGNINAADYARMMHLPGYHRELDLVAVTRDGVVAAYVNGWVDPVNLIGDFGPVGALSTHRRRGLTRAVLLEGLRRLQARGMERVCVSTTMWNTPARQLYASIGFRVVNEYFDYTRA